MAKKKSLAAGKRALALFLAFSIILTGASAAPGGPVGQVAASHDGCSQVEEWGYLLTRGLWFDNCDPSDLSDHADDLEELHENATETDIYNTGSQTAADSEQFRGVMNNYLQDSGTAAMAEAEAAAVEAIDEGKTESEVEQAAVDAVKDYYTVKQMNLVDQWNIAASTVWTMENTSDAAGLSETFVSPKPEQTSALGDTLIYTLIDSRSTETITLRNGSDYLIHELKIHREIVGESTATQWFRVDTGSAHINSATDFDPVVGIKVDPISGQTSVEALTFDDYESSWNSIDSKSNQMEANAQVYADSLYNQTQNGTANVTDHISCATLSEQYSTDFETTGFYAYAVGFGACQGMAVPQLDNTSLMTIQTASDTYNGLLMSQNPPAGGIWETGVTYNAQNIQGLQMVATTDGEIVELDGQFTIQSMEGPDGTEHDTTTVRHINRTVINESADYSELQDEIRTLREEIEDVEPPGGSGGGGDGGLGLDLGLGGTGAIVIAAGAAAFLLLGRN